MESKRFILSSDVCILTHTFSGCTFYVNLIQCGLGTLANGN